MEKELTLFHSAFRSHIDSMYSDESKLSQACRYALEGKGKRIRPLLTLSACKIFSDDWKQALPAAISVEMVHTYSLVHDDLPVMDNDDLRRGRPTVHKVFDEATALLVGDALLSDAFMGLRDLKMVSELSRAIGSSGMVYGQSLDLQWTGKSGYTLEDLNRIHIHKTGKLFGASCALGAIAAQASDEEVILLRNFGEELGLAFQIMDDLIDEKEGTGKSSGKDRALGKLTYLSLMTYDEAHDKASSILKDLKKDLERYGDRADSLKALLGRLDSTV